MRKLLLFHLFCIASFTIKAQNYGNEWINYSQQYFKIPIVNEGIYRIDSTTLSNYYNLNAVNPKNFQLFLKGKEQYLFIKGESDNKINTGDYLEFYASAFMGDVDSLVYTHIKYMPNPFKGLYNDTVYAFLTLTNSINNKRYTLETDTNSALYPLANYYYGIKINSFTNTYNQVKEYSSSYLSDPRYTQAEGRGNEFTLGNSLSTNFSNLYTYTNTSLPFYISLNYSGSSINFSSSSNDHNIQTFYSNQNGNSILIADTLFYGCKPVRQTFTLNNQNTNNSTTLTVFSNPSPSISATANTTILHYVQFFYPKTLNLGNNTKDQLYIDNVVGSSKQFFNFSNFNYGNSSSVELLDVSNGKKISTVISAPNVRAVVPNGLGRKFCFMSGDSQIVYVKSLVKANQTGTFTNFKNSFANKPYVIIYHKSLESSTFQYRDYRQSINGGSYNVIAANIDELYEQFGFGVNKHPIAIKNFVKFLKDSLQNKPNYVLLIGKGIYLGDIGPNFQNRNLIPTMGIPSSDNLLVAALSPSNTNTFAPEIPIGRLAATSNTDIINYLAKVQEHESSGPADWKKRVLHFVGGDKPYLINSISNWMSSYEQTIKAPYFGAEVFTVKKNTSAPIQLNISDSIKNVISNGASLLNFFGHGSEQGFDQAIDNPNDYHNSGKYPFFIANSCYSGNLFIYDRSSASENFVFAKQKGSIGFLATTSTSYDNNLNDYNIWFYKALSQTKYMQGIGDVIKETCIQNANATVDSLSKFAGLEFILHGDPALKIGNGLLPDYQITNADVAFNLKKYTDSIGVTIHIKNLGRAVQDSFAVKIDRFFPNGDSTTFFKTIPSTLFKDSLSFFTPLDFNRGIGLNQFKVRIDYFNAIAESIETNNATLGTVDLFIPGGDIVPIYPYKYAIVPKTNSLILKASTTDPFAPEGSYRFQLDTCDKFINPIQVKTISSKGGVVEWQVNLPFADSTVYFWRVSRDSISPTNAFIWKESSFQTIGSKRGWGQSHFNQFKNDAYQFVNYNRLQRKFSFQNNFLSIACRNALFPTIEGTQIGYFFNTITMSAWTCSPNGWNIAVFDSISGEPQKQYSANQPGFGLYNNFICVPDQILPYYNFGPLSTTPNWKSDMEVFLNAIAPGNYVLAFNVGFASNGSQIHTYSNNLFNSFESIGANHLRTVIDTVPYILFGKKGMVVGQGHELIGVDKKSILYLEDSIKTKWHSGYIASELIGPSYKWNSLHWRVNSLDNGSGDSTILKVVGIANDGSIDTLAVFAQTNTDILALDSYVDAKTYPYLKLIAFMQDNIYTTSPQLKRWQVLYDEAPECAINPLKGFATINDTLQEGDNVTFRFPIENVGVKNFEDSLVITYWIEDNVRNKIPLPSKMKARPFIPGQVLIDTVTINSYQLKGNNALWIFVNPIQHANYQKEQFQFNNIGRFPFKVTTDVTNPLLDVTFDGIRILNGDIVSAKPTILITLKDENKFLALNDTSAFTLYLLAPNQTLQQRLYFGQGLQFTPANLPKNNCSILYTPVFSVDGKYTLIAQAKDRSKNNSGSQEYRVQFEVNNKPSVTSVLNYPNPFSTRTKFVFTITGSEVPEVFTIQIMTISGKIIREITREELGNLHIGRNITDYAWDGKDMYGDKLANGVYLYRVVTKLNGENIEKNASGADKYFVKEFGKMVIMR